MSRYIRGHIKPSVKVPTIIATDGSAWYAKRDKLWHTGCGWISTDGSYEASACPIPADQVGREPAVVTELRAVWHAVRQRVPERSAVLFLDSGHAVRFLDAWADGNLIMPAGYVGSGTHEPMLARMARFVGRHHPLMAWVVVKGHNGHLLNEAADSLAKIGREWCRNVYDKDEATTRTHRLAAGFLADDRLAEVA